VQGDRHAVVTGAVVAGDDPGRCIKIASITHGGLLAGLSLIASDSQKERIAAVELMLAGPIRAG